MKTSIVVIICFLFLNLVLLQASYAAYTDGYEPDNSSPQARLIWNGTEQQHTISPVGDGDWVKFTIPRDCNVVIETSGAVGDTRMWLYRAATPMEYTIYQNNFDTDPGWTTQGEWAFGQPTGGGNVDPTSGYTGTNVYGYNLNGDYPDNLSPAQYLCSNWINCSGYSSVKLKFWRWLGVESSTFDHASIEVRNGGSSWVTVWQNPDYTIIDGAWVYQEFDISSIADNQSFVAIRWGMGTTDGSVTYCGWNIDDVQLTGMAPSADFIEYDDDSGVDYFSRIDRVCGVDALSAGTYYVQIDEYGDDQEIDEYFIQITITPCAQSIIYVDDDAASDPGPGDPSVSDPLEDGSAAHPYDAIQEAVNISLDGDIVLVKDGTYTGLGNFNIDFAQGLGGWENYTRNITVRSENGAKSTIIECAGEYSGFDLYTSENSNSLIEGFTIQGAGGTGISLSNSSPTIRSCIIRANYNSGIWSSYGGTPVIDKCHIENNGNFSSSFAGGICCYNSAAIIVNSIISNNIGGADAGGIMFEDCQSGNPSVINCTIYGNYGGDRSGGVNCFWSNPSLVNCTIMQNYSTNNGGGMSLDFASNPVLTNCTIINNDSGGNGGGIYSSGNSNPVIRNSILWENYPNEFQEDPLSPGNPLVEYCDIRGGWSGSGGNNINADPEFIDFDLLPSEIPQIYYRLASGSPCIDAGSSDFGNPNDIDGKERYDDPLTANTGGGFLTYYDIGAYEFKAFYVNDTTGNDSWDGRLPYWNGGSGPKKTIQEGLNVAETGTQVIVAPGTYTGTGNRDLSYSGKDLHLLSEMGTLQTIIDCQASSSNEHRGILFVNNETPRAVVKGFTIKNGYFAITSSGGAIACADSNPTILDCHLIDNTAYYSGAIDCMYASPTIANCIMSGNRALGPLAYGGAIEVYYGDPLIKNCLITNNWADIDGGGIMCYGGVPIIENCTIYGNAAGYNGGGIFIQYSPIIRNCIIWNNSPESIKVWGSAAPIVTYSDIQGGTGQPWFGVGCIDVSPDFAIGPLHNFYLSQTAAGQSTNSPCVDTGESSAEYYGLNRYTTRTDSVPDSGQVDMGYHARYICRIDNIWRSGGNVVIHWNAIPGVSYYVEWSTDMLAWNEISVGAVTQWTDTNTAGYTKKFYRVRER